LEKEAFALGRAICGNGRRDERKPEGSEMGPIEKRISGLKSKIRRNAAMEDLQGLTGPRSSQSAGPGGDIENEDIGKLMRQNREQASKGNIDGTPITDQMP
jgi:hypothetical protein